MRKPDTRGMRSPTADRDALSSMLADTHGASASGAPAARPMDFRRPRQFSTDVQRRLRRALDTFCRTASSRLSSELRAPADLEVAFVEELTWSDAHDQIPASALTAVLAAEPINTRLLLSAEQPLLLTAIERMLGGSATQPLTERRLTDIDATLARQLFEALVDQLSVVWDELVDVNLSVAALVGPQQSAQLVPTSEPTLAVTIEAVIEGGRHALQLLMPYRALSPVMERLTRVEGYDATVDTASADAMDRRMRQVDMEVRAEVGAVELPISDLLALEPGDLLVLGGSARAGISLYVDGTPVERGRPGRSGPRRAVQVLGRGESAA